jgi:hypothetical protein
LLTGRVLYRGFFTNVDEIASTIHARYLANGLLAGPIGNAPEAWLIPNTLMVSEGWVSHFPPTNLFAMAALIRLGVPTLLGPIFAGALAGLLALSLPRLLPEHPGPARVAALLIAVTPFVFLLGGGSMSHVSASAFGAAVLYAGLRARDGSVWWGVAAGAAVGLMVSDRPLIGLVLGTVFTLGVWGPAAFGDNPHGRAWLLRRAGAALLGGAPFALFLGWFNQRLYGNPLTLGYIAAFGDRHRLGFHMDPWGYPYGLREAVAFTSSDVLSLGVQLLETPFPITAVIGLYLLFAPRLPKGAAVLAAWAFLPVVANAYYWFHDVRMLFEAAPAWITLGVIAALGLAGGFGPYPRRTWHRRGRTRRRSLRARTLPRSQRLGCGHDHVGHSYRRGRIGRVGGSEPVGQLPLERGNATTYYRAIFAHAGTHDRLRTHLLERAAQLSPSGCRRNEAGQRHHAVASEYELRAPSVCFGAGGRRCAPSRRGPRTDPRYAPGHRTPPPRRRVPRFGRDLENPLEPHAPER